MLEYYASKLARQEHEQRVKSLTPVQDHDALLTDDRQLAIYPILAGTVGTSNDQPGWVSKYVGQVLTTMGNNLSALGERMKQGRDGIPG